MGHPLGHGGVFEVVGEELGETDLVVFLVLQLCEAVAFVVVVEQPGRFLESAQGDEEFDALGPGDRAVVVVVHDQDRCGYFVHGEDRGVFEETLRDFPDRAEGLVMLVLGGAASAGLPADAAVGTEEIGDGCARRDAGEHLGSRGQVGDLIAAVAVALDADPLGVDKAFVHERGDARHDRFVGALADVAGVEVDVRVEDKVAVAHEVMVVDPGAVELGHAVIVKLVGGLVEELDDHRVLFGWIEIGRLVEDAFERLAVE